MRERCTMIVCDGGYVPCMNRRSVHVKLGQLSQKQIKRSPVIMVRIFNL